ncbi:haloacid dehalogenase type II [Aurantimonas sp. E1-2-R+4]|uniref:haloacid dehalogenase type II n=1 Tax=Aurantimonas sp. E1-2-R+4 TaxID=3113714 RepID=UPI002F95EE62
MKKLITFDVYSALFDIAGSIAPRVASRLSLSETDARAFFALWRDKQMERLQLSNSLDGERVPFRDATRQSFDYAVRLHRLEASPDLREELVAAWDEINPWPEAESVVREVKDRGYQTAILSNGDEAMLKAVASRIGDPFDHVFSSEHAGRYKPHPAVYRLPQQRLGLSPADILHVAGSRTDALGAAAAGLECFWSNRADDAVLDPRYAPTYDRRDLTDLTAILQAS